MRSDSQGKIRRLDSYWPRCYCTGVSTQKLHSVFNERQIKKTKSLCVITLTVLCWVISELNNAFAFQQDFFLSKPLLQWTTKHRIHLPWSCQTRSRTNFMRSSFFTFTGCLWTDRGNRRDADGIGRSVWVHAEEGDGNPVQSACRCPPSPSFAAQALGTPPLRSRAFSLSAGCSTQLSMTSPLPGLDCPGRAQFVIQNRKAIYKIHMHSQLNCLSCVSVY